MRNVGAEPCRATRAGHLDADVLRAHSLDHVLHQMRFAFRRIEVEFTDDLLEARAAQDLLIERGQAVLEPHSHGRLHVGLGNLLRHDEDERLGAKPVWQSPGHCHRRHRDEDEGHQHQPLSPPDRL